MDYLYPLLKALHVISVISWFAGLLYIPRLYVYYVEAESKPDDEKTPIQAQLAVMMRRLWYGITTPAMILTAIFGIWVMIKFDIYKQPWLHLKLLFVFFLFGYHGYLGRIRRRILSGTNTLSSLKLRLINEIGTAFLIIIVLIAYLKSFFSGVWSVVTFILTLGILLGTVVYLKRRR